MSPAQALTASKPRVDKKLPYDGAYYIGKRGIWSIQVRNQGVATVSVQVVDVRENYGRVDLLIETDTGSRVWVSNQTVSVEKPGRYVTK